MFEWSEKIQIKRICFMLELKTGLYVSFNGGQFWEKIPAEFADRTDYRSDDQDNDMIVATQGRAFWG